MTIDSAKDVEDGARKNMVDVVEWEKSHGGRRPENVDLFDGAGGERLAVVFDPSVSASRRCGPVIDVHAATEGARDVLGNGGTVGAQDARQMTARHNTMHRNAEYGMAEMKATMQSVTAEMGGMSIHLTHDADESLLSDT